MNKANNLYITANELVWVSDVFSIGAFSYRQLLDELNKYHLYQGMRVEVFARLIQSVATANGLAPFPFLNHSPNEIKLIENKLRLYNILPDALSPWYIRREHELSVKELMTLKSGSFGMPVNLTKYFKLIKKRGYTGEVIK